MRISDGQTGALEIDVTPEIVAATSRVFQISDERFSETTDCAASAIASSLEPGDYATNMVSVSKPMSRAHVDAQ
jgi:hypothetical protein